MSAPSISSAGKSRLTPGPLTLAAKRTVDILLTSVFFASLGWLYLLIWLAVRISSGSPSLYSQPRCGRNGKIFRFYKFRSMVNNADQVLHRHLAENPQAREEWRVFQKLEKDPRITRFGAFIRKYSLDELPQIWNVLRGDMSLVGPRPCMFGQKDLYGNYWRHYCAVKPGITGLWQVSGRSKVSYRRRAAMDATYVETLSMRSDMRILLKTIRVIITANGSC